MDKDKINKELEEIDKRIGEKIRERRIYLKMTQPDLAEQIGTTFQQVQKYEKDINRVAASRLYRVHKVLHVPLSYFFAEPLHDCAGLDGTFAYEPDFIRWVQQYPIVPEHMRMQLIKLIESMNNP